MKFRTEYCPDKSRITLDPSIPVVLLGSCFSQNMAERMLAHKWEAINPLGTLYNPYSILVALDMMLDQKKGVERFEKSLFQGNGIWNSHYFDSSFSSLNQEDSIKHFENNQNLLIEALKKGAPLIVTFGTSRCYYLKSQSIPVGNCHKMPAELYYNQRLSLFGTSCDWLAELEQIEKDYPAIKVIFTVSPVRHLKDGFIENARSKALLLLYVEEICRYSEITSYFPAFEILNDDLRDYRFYASDLTHPSDEAKEYIWEKFVETYIDEKGKEYLKTGNKEIKASQHRPLRGALGKPLS